ncbi:MAG: hypothetical protein JW864_13770 [Spirochaetes bacterium]|nr:hypothetical protein [Spirochaetota bacterium]
MKKRIHHLYDFDVSDQTYVIRISPDKYLDIFNKLDNYPIRKRDINQNVINYIEECSNDIPLSDNIKIEFQIKNEQRNIDLEERTRKGIQNFFLYELAIHKMNSLKVIKASILYVFIFTILTVTTFSIEVLNIKTGAIFFKTILEGLSIGSWVFLWEAIAGIVIKNNTNRHLIKTYKRLLKSSLVFSY